MSADFWAGYLSGAVGIVVGNPLDLIKVRLQAQGGAAVTKPHFQSAMSLATGTAAPILGYGALNALLFVSYNRSEAALNNALGVQSSLWTTWLAGAGGGLATWAVSTPTELVKCRVQTSASGTSSWSIVQQTWRADGVRGLYFGGVVTALRDSIGYGFYFWSYELATGRWNDSETLRDHEGLRILLCGGLAGVVTWASVFPLDVIKTRVQTQIWNPQPESEALIRPARRSGALQIARETYAEGGARVFFRGLAVCSVRAFIVNAVQWAVYEWIMREMGPGRKQREP